MRQSRFIVLLFLLYFATGLRAELVEYQLDIAYGTVNKSGAPATAMLVNGQYPGPVLRFREGDTARITVTNHLDVNSSVHWHGLLLPPEMDGVPYISYLPIGPGESFVYEFPLRHAGTYWYHSHTDLQEQSGVHGGIVVEPREPGEDYDYEQVVVLQDWTDENPHQVLANLKKDGDYYALKKDSVISIAGYWQRDAMANWWDNRWMRMGGMDVSDVAYDTFLMNGEKELVLFPDAQPGDKIRLRFINAGTSSYFLLHSAELPLQVVAADGLDVRPQEVDEVLHAVAETYDIVVTVPEDASAELRATSQDGSGFASLFIGDGPRRYAADMPKPNLYASHAMHGDGDVMDHSMHAGMDHSMHQSGPRRLAYSDLRTLAPENYIGTGDVREVELRLTGNMETYNWTFNDIPLSRADKILISRGETVRFKFVNETMMHHPLHLHGHFFRVLADGEDGPFKHTVDVPPLETVTIEFLANEEKDWFFHCHNLYHAKTGMGRVIRYDDYNGTPALMEAKKRSPDIVDTDFYYAGELKLLHDYGRLEGWVANAQHHFEAELESLDYEDERGEAAYLYRINRWTQVLIGAEKEEGEDTEGKLGFRYVLPLLIDMDLYVTDDGDVEAAFETEFQLSKRVQMHWEWETTYEYHFGVEYRLNEQLSLEAAYTDDVDASVGLKLRF